MTIGILGAGAIGSSFAHMLARKGIAATIANSRGADSLAPLVAELGPLITAGAAEAAAAADIVLVAINWQKLPAALAGLPAWNGRIVIDANNAIEMPDFRAAELHGRTSSEVVADLVPGARVVKAFNHLVAAALAADPQEGGGRRTLFYAGDDAEAKAEVAALIARLGFFDIDFGGLAGGGRMFQFPGGPLAGHNLVRLD